MRRDHRPYLVKKAHLKFQDFYVNHFLRPQFDSLGEGFTILHPWNVEVFGPRISLGRFANLITTSERKIWFTVWSDSPEKGRIQIGDYCLICPGVRISAATEIVIEDNCMLASGVYVTDSDWHDTYDRIATIGKTAPVHIGRNVWIGDGALVCKGVTIGENSIVGAGSVVVNDVPANTIAAGNPAKAVRQLDPKQKIITRSEWFRDPVRLSGQIDEIDREMLRKNTFRDWLRSMLVPAKGD